MRISLCVCILVVLAQMFQYQPSWNNLLQNKWIIVHTDQQLPAPQISAHVSATQFFSIKLSHHTSCSNNDDAHMFLILISRAILTLTTLYVAQNLDTPGIHNPISEIYMHMFTCIYIRYMKILCKRLKVLNLARRRCSGLY